MAGAGTELLQHWNSRLIPGRQMAGAGTELLQHGNSRLANC